MDWAGFDVDSGCPVCLDSAGWLRVLMRPMGWQWVPVLDIVAARKSSVHRLWPVAVKVRALSDPYVAPI